MAKQSVNVLTLGKTPLTTILKLAWPTIIEQMMFTVLNFSDTAMVGVLGAVATALRWELPLLQSGSAAA